MKLLKAEKKEQKMVIEQQNDVKKLTNFTAQSIEELVKNSENFLKHLLVVNDSFYSIFYNKGESRVYVEKSLFKSKLEAIFLKNIADDEMLEVIQSINKKNSMKLGFKLLLDEFKELDFDIEERAFSGQWIFINMLYEESILIKELKKIAKNLKSGSRLSLENKKQIESLSNKNFKNSSGGNDE
ncbi:hypothetical protein [Sulfurimonas sp.]|uniref:hypothetical protein n=1 Tax=Sulfurimonas sp. TaxID=2022749 RepID=UPI0025F83B30|nr:hypothetical protein [Sulfurimonas sp.]